MSADKTSVVSADKTPVVSADISQDIPQALWTEGRPLRGRPSVQNVGGMSWEMSADTTDVLSADTTDVLSADTTDVLSADTTDVLSADTTDVLSADTTDVLSADAGNPEIPRGRRLPSTAVTIKWEQK